MISREQEQRHGQGRHGRDLPGGIRTPHAPVAHRDDEYPEAGFEILSVIQERHFWYRGRHRFLLAAVRALLRRSWPATAERPSAVDLGGGCGGWIAYLRAKAPTLFGELALADSSLRALELAAATVGADVPRYQVDLLRLEWDERWDAAFLLDVIEHIPDDHRAVAQARDALRPGGLLFITAPALDFFWSYNDVIAEHRRRYSCDDVRRLAATVDMELCMDRYFMFFLSPLYALSRLARQPRLDRMTPAEVRALCERTHHPPSPLLLNTALALAFGAETPLGLWCPFPWGTSILAVLRKRPR